MSKSKSVAEPHVPSDQSVSDDRRIFLRQLATFSGGAVLLPWVTRCGSSKARREYNTPATKYRR